MDILRSWGDDDLAKTWAEHKALSAGDPTAGGFLIPTQFSQDVIPLLRASAVVRSLDPLVIPVPTGSVRVPKITAGATASYIGENTNIGTSQPTFGQITLAFKKLAALVPLSNDLLRYSSPAADGIVRDDVVRALAAREDKAFIRDTGVDATPKGLRNWIHSDNKFNSTGTTIAATTNDLGEMIRLLMAANVPLIITQFPAGGSVDAVDVRPGWLMSPRTYKHLTTIRTTNGPFAFRDEMLRGTLWGFPYRVTSQILETMTAAGADTGGNQTELYFGGFAYAVIGESLNLVVDVSQEAAYDDSGTVRAAFSLDQTIVRVIAEHDFALRQDKGFALLQQVTWGV
jgi:HK97 family phage major capsid protein